MSAAWNSIFGFERLSLCDWPGYASCVIFTGGCNMRCPTCHNWQLAWEAASLPVFPRKDIERYIRARAGWLDGIVITGGEATEVEGIADLARDLRAYGLPIKMDTNGLRPDVVELLLRDNLVDAFSVDVKGPWHLYPRLSGNTTSAAEAERCLGHVFRLAMGNPGVFLFRQTRVPLLSDEDVEMTRTYLPEGHTLATQDYIPPRRKHAEADTQTGRTAGDMVAGSHRGGHPQGPQS